MMSKSKEILYKSQISYDANYTNISNTMRVLMIFYLFCIIVVVFVVNNKKYTKFPFHIISNATVLIMTIFLVILLLLSIIIIIIAKLTI